MPDTNTIDKYIIITFSMVNNPYPYHPCINSTYHSTNAFHFTGISIWNDRSAVIKSSSKSLCEFRRKIIIVEILIEDG